MRSLLVLASCVVFGCAPPAPPLPVGGSPISSWEPGALDAATKTHPSVSGLAFVSPDRQRHRGDSIHDSPSARELGRRYAAAYLERSRR